MRIKMALALTASFAAISSTAAAEEARGVYVGVFGGGGISGDTEVTQRGTVYFIEAAGGPLAVNARGDADGESAWFVGGQVGYEMSSSSGILPAFEIEGLYLDTGDRSASLQNPNVRLAEQAFDTSFSTNSFALLANLVFSFPDAMQNLTPYVGVGLGGVRVSADDATSIATDPAEPGVNHFNTDAEAAAWTFAAQAKAGLRVTLGSNVYAFGEYRYLHIGEVEPTFGSTEYPGHAATSPWTVTMEGASLHLASVGIGIGF